MNSENTNRKKHTHESLGKRLGVSAGAISQWLGGIKPTPFVRAIEIEHEVGVDNFDAEKHHPELWKKIVSVIENRKAQQ